MLRFLLVIALACFTVAHAQDKQRPRPSNLQPLPDAPPPPSIKADPELEPQVTITQNKEGAKVEEYRVRGKLFAMKVTPVVGPSYYLLDERGDGQFVRRDSLDTGLRVPSWVIVTF